MDAGLPPIEVSDLKVGYGPVATVESTVTLHYRVAYSDAELADGQCIETTWGGPTVTVVLGRGLLLYGLEIAVLGMRVGTERRVRVPAAQAFGDGECQTESHPLGISCLNSIFSMSTEKRGSNHSTGLSG